MQFQLLSVRTGRGRLHSGDWVETASPSRSPSGASRSPVRRKDGSRSRPRSALLAMDAPAQRAAAPPLQEGGDVRRRARVLVIGAGFAGTALAIRLAAGGACDVTLVDRRAVLLAGRPPAGASLVLPARATPLAPRRSTRGMHTPHPAEQKTRRRRKPYFEVAYANARALVDPGLADKTVVPIEARRRRRTPCVVACFSLRTPQRPRPCAGVGRRAFPQACAALTSDARLPLPPHLPPGPEAARRLCVRRGGGAAPDARAARRWDVPAL